MTMNMGLSAGPPPNQACVLTQYPNGHFELPGAASAAKDLEPDGKHGLSPCDSEPATKVCAASPVRVDEEVDGGVILAREAGV